MIAPFVVGLALLSSAQAPSTAATPPVPVVTFEALWTQHVRAAAAGDKEGAERALREIRRLRMERNVESLDRVGLALVESGSHALGEGQREDAEFAFARAVGLAPGLPDGHYGLSWARLKQGPLGVVGSINATIGGVSDFLATGRGALNGGNLLSIAFLLTAFAVSVATAAALLLRHGGLLRHDIDEWLGPAQSRSASLALTLLLLLLPVATFQGWGWLPLWWLALLFAYSSRGERGVAIVVLLAGVLVGPEVASLELRLRTAQNPLYRAALSVVEGVPDPSALARLEQAARADPEDRDLVYLLGAAYKRTGRYEEAAQVFRQRLAADPQDPIARNNLGNIEYALGSYDAARERYQLGTRAASSPQTVATSYYNLSLAHLRKFDYQAFNEAKSNADRLARGLVEDYDRWKYDTGDYAVVDLGLDREQVWTKFAGAESGVAVRNVLGSPSLGPRAGVLMVSAANRFTGAILVFALVAWLVGRARGPKAFTLHCARCGTAFCRFCHLGQVSGELCSQCFHIFVIRDGVSAPARNRKLQEVQEEDARRERMFRVLSLVSPGAGQLYGGRTVTGFLLQLLWYGVLAGAVAHRLVPFTEVAGTLVPPWPLIATVLVLVALYVLANRIRPDFEVRLPVRRPGPRRGRVAQGAA